MFWKTKREKQLEVDVKRLTGLLDALRLEKSGMVRVISKLENELIRHTGRNGRS